MKKFKCIATILLAQALAISMSICSFAETPKTPANTVQDASLAVAPVMEEQIVIPSAEQLFAAVSPVTLITNFNMYANVVNSTGKPEKILVQNVGGEEFLFLPSNANLSALCLVYQPAGKLSVKTAAGLIDIQSGMPFDANSLMSMPDKRGVRVLSLCSVMPDGSVVDYKLNVMQSAYIASMFIKSKDPLNKGLYFVESIKGNAADGTLDVIEANGAPSYTGPLAQVKGRGNSTWAGYKKPFQIKLGTKADLALTGDPSNANKTWVLLANAFDPTLLRNKVSYDLARSMGIISPDCRFVDLYFDGIYLGNYLVSEKVEAGKGRVPISEGGYLLEMDDAYYAQEDYYFVDVSNKAFVIKSPDKPTKEQISYINSFMNDAITAAMNKGVNPNTGLSVWDYVDMESLARYYVLEQLTKDPDAFYSSAYFYLIPGGKLYAGPAWDFDSSFGVVKINNYNSTSGIINSTGWMSYFLRLPEFKKAVRTFQTTVNTNLVKAELANLDNDAAIITNSRMMNDVLWKGIDYKYYALPTYSQNLKYLRNFIVNRNSYLNSVIGR